jgi:uncharacterized protein with von Willebrand factor type A (vWA) domain
VNRVQAEGGPLVANLARFGRVLRAAGLEVGPGRIQDAVRALTVVEMGSREQVYWALRCTLVSKQADIEPFDHAFALFWQGVPPARADPATGPGTEPGPGSPDPPDAPVVEKAIVDGAEAFEGDAGADEEAAAGMRFSASERLRGLDFAQYSDAEHRQAMRLVERIAAAVPLRRSRRLRIASEGRVFDKRRTLRSAMRTEGYPIARLWREPRILPRKLLFAVDVSGSMEPYARAMVMFLQAAVRSGRHVEAFTFGTRLTRVTRELEERDPDRALTAATRVVPDWAGGTRIGTNLKALNDHWGRLGLTRGAVVVIVSDGWERGEISTLVHEMQRLRRTAHAVVWVNPLAGQPGYEPIAEGMAASLPYIDHFLPGHNLRSLESMAEVLESIPHLRPRRRAAQAVVSASG